MKVEEVLDKHTDRLMSIPGVEGVGIGGSDDKPVIIVMVSQGGTAMRKQLPAQIEGYPVRVDVTGGIVAH